MVRRVARAVVLSLAIALAIVPAPLDVYPDTFRSSRLAGEWDAHLQHLAVGLAYDDIIKRTS